MSELFLQISVSLDGHIEDKDGDIEWMTSDPSIDPFTGMLQSIEGMIFGRKAHALLAGFWPTAGEDKGASADLVEQARLMNELPKYVLTHGEEKTGWANSRAIRLDDIPRLKTEARRPLAIFAGAMAAQQVLAQGSIDEIRLIQYPILLGGGKRLFNENGRRLSLRFVESRSFDSGATLNRYRVGS